MIASTTRKQAAETPAPERILAVVITMITTQGSDAVQLTEVAQRARVSMTTIYKNFTSRDELVLAAVKAWMDSHVYQPLTEPVPDVPLFDALVWLFRHVYDPWERNPRMAEAFMRARFGPGGDRLMMQGLTAVEPLARELLKDVDRDYADDVMVIMSNLAYAMVVRFAAGEVPVTDIMPTIERALRRLTGETAGSAPTRPSTSRSRQRRQSVPRTS